MSSANPRVLGSARERVVGTSRTSPREEQQLHGGGSAFEVEDTELQALSPEGDDRSKPRFNRCFASVCAIITGVLVLVALMVFAVLAVFRNDDDAPKSTAADLHAQADLSNAVPNDLWAIHDLLMIGYTAVFMTPGSPGQAEVRQAATEFARLLPALHPHEPCRARLASLLGAPGAGEPAANVPDEEMLVQAAEASWSCLPGKFFFNSFDQPFRTNGMKDADQAFDARMTRVRNQSLLGVCRNSHWDRTCSIWVSIHAMAARADVLGLAKPFLSALVPVIAGGATMCGGCTMHFRALSAPLLSPSVVWGFGDVF
mmetsp:Transcript_1577/g.6229  ORF Transcript_1577/g.6229 Transcript_1577/m.6229 type:complete len:314 (-) Transcript_1577:690-1631(-)